MGLLAQASNLWVCFAKPLTERQKVRSRVIGINQCRLSGRGAIGKVREGGEGEAEPATEQRIE